jgi:DNA polymerase elongation subunit (family B)
MIQTCAGWILDVHLENGEAVIWIKTDQGQTLRLFDEYYPSLYLQPKSEKHGCEIIEILSDLPLIREIKWQSKLTSIFEPMKEKLIHVTTPTIHHYNLLLKALRHERLRERINKTFNAHLSHLQRYLFEQLKVKLGEKVYVQFEDHDLISIDNLQSKDVNSPFSLMHVEVIPQAETNILDMHDSIQSININFENKIRAFEGDESQVLLDFSDYILLKDPDIIVVTSHDLTLLSYLFERMKILSLNLQLGRYKINVYDNFHTHVFNKWTQGRIYLTQREYTESGIAGLIELSNFSYLPIKQVLCHSIGRLISNRNCYELLSRDFVISDKNERSHENIRTLEEIVDDDKAGMIFSPQVGLHENVAVLDYNDEFANIIVNNNISYETRQSNSNKGILPIIVRQLLEQRLRYRELLKTLTGESKDCEHYMQRYEIIKKILVCLYGTTGSYWNKYGNVLAFEEINRKSREILLKTKDIVQNLGYELVYADTDAAFVHKDDAKREDYEKLGERISKEIGLSLTLEYHYKFLVLLPLEADEKLEALKYYFGITYDRELVMRGIETRRHDSPEFIKQFQTELLYTLFECDNPEEISNKTLGNALFCVTKTIDKIMTGEIKTNDLIISKQLRMDITKYTNVFPHVAAAIQLSSTSKKPVRGDIIQYIYTNSQHQNPLNKVVAVDGFLENIEYDREKYKELLLDAAETVLGIFGFDRTLYGKAKDNKWWMELKRNRTQDVLAEVTGS